MAARLGTAQKRTVLLTYQQAAERAGTSSAWWQRLAKRGGVRVVRLGRRSCRLLEEDVERILREGVRPVRAEAVGHATDSLPQVVA